MGVEPTSEGNTPAHTVLKTGEATGPHPPPGRRGECSIRKLGLGNFETLRNWGKAVIPRREPAPPIPSLCQGARDRASGDAFGPGTRFAGRQCLPSVPTLPSLAGGVLWQGYRYLCALK